MPLRQPAKHSPEYLMGLFQRTAKVPLIAESPFAVRLYSRSGGDSEFPRELWHAIIANAVFGALVLLRSL